MRAVIKLFFVLIIGSLYVTLAMHWKSLDWEWWQGCYFAAIFIFAISFISLVFKR